VRIQHADGMNNTILELYLYRGQWQLGTANALYSDGWRYRPIAEAFRTLTSHLSSVRKMLVLGVGLGSAAMMMGRRRLYPEMTLVDHDKTSLEWAIQLQDERTAKHLKPVCEDEAIYMREDAEKFDLMIVDIFEDRVVPAFVTETTFLQLCHDRIADGGHFVMNYIENKQGDWETVQKNIRNVFPLHDVIQFGINKVVVARQQHTMET